jgi:hypothetical protein
VVSPITATLKRTELAVEEDDEKANQPVRNVQMIE